MADPRRPGQAALARAIAEAQRERVPDSPLLQGAVQSVGGGRVMVLVNGVGTFRCPYLAPYSPASGDVVWLGRIAPGSYLCLGRQAG